MDEHSRDPAAGVTMPSNKVKKMPKTTEEDHDSDYSDPNEGFNSASEDSDYSMDLSESSDEDIIDVSNFFYSF